MDKFVFYTDQDLIDRFDSLVASIKKESDHMWSLIEAENPALANKVWDIVCNMNSELYEIKKEMIYRESAYKVWGLIA